MTERVYNGLTELTLFVAIDFVKTFDDIKALWINRQRETLNLEFKADLNSNPNEIAKDISAMGNAEGGVIIYGIKEDKTGAASDSVDGIEINKKDERIQQIVNSSIFPELHVRIEIIRVQDNTGNAIQNKGFIIVRVPKSELQIHQVGTTAIYYARNNTLAMPYRFEPTKLMERDVALRYEKRFENKKRIQDSLERRHAEVLGQVGDYIFLASVPQVVSLTRRKIDKRFFNSVLFNKENGDSISPHELKYKKISDDYMFFHNLPNANGRQGSSKEKALGIEMDNEGSIYAFHRRIGQIDLWSALEMFIEFLHLLNRFYSRLEYFGGITIRFEFRSTFRTDELGVPVFSQETYAPNAIPRPHNTNANAKHIMINKDLQFSSIEFEQVFWDIFPNIFEQLGIDDPEQKFVPKMKEFDEKISNLKLN